MFLARIAVVSLGRCAPRIPATPLNFALGRMEGIGMNEVIVRVAALCVVLAGTETLHGIFRATVLVPKIGKKSALKVSIVTGAALAFFVCYLLVPGIGVTDSPGLFAIGVILALFMVSFDITLARVLLRLPWAKILRDFDPRTGNYLTLGLLLLVAFPYAVMQIR